MEQVAENLSVLRCAVWVVDVKYVDLASVLRLDAVVVVDDVDAGGDVVAGPRRVQKGWSLYAETAYAWKVWRCKETLMVNVVVDDSKKRNVRLDEHQK